MSDILWALLTKLPNLFLFKQSASRLERTDLHKHLPMLGLFLCLHRSYFYSLAYASTMMAKYDIFFVCVDIWGRSWVQSNQNFMKTMSSNVCCRWNTFLCCWLSLEKSRRWLHCVHVQQQYGELVSRRTEMLSCLSAQFWDAKDHEEDTNIRGWALSSVTWFRNYLSACIFTHLSLCASRSRSTHILVIGDREQKLLGKHSEKEDNTSVAGIFIVFFQFRFADDVA